MVKIKRFVYPKKRYAALIYDLEGNRQDVDNRKLKAMGLDLKGMIIRFVQNFHLKY